MEEGGKGMVNVKRDAGCVIGRGQKEMLVLVGVRTIFDFRRFLIFDLRRSALQNCQNCAKEGIICRVDGLLPPAPLPKGLFKS